MIWEASMMKWIGVAALAAFILMFGGQVGTCFTTKAQAAVQKLKVQDATDFSARRRYRHYHHYAYRPYYYGSPYYYGPGPFFPFVPFFGFGWGPW
jgi:hypothetical protein